MSFGGAIDSMINSNRSNLRELKARRSNWKPLRRFKHKNYSLDDLQLTSESKKILHQKLVHYQRQSYRRKIARLVITLVVLAAILFWISNADFSNVIDLID
jgi:hypothetical protein